MDKEVTKRSQKLTKLFLTYLFDLFSRVRLTFCNNVVK